MSYSRPTSTIPVPRYPNGIACIAVVGKQNNPLLIQTFGNAADHELKYHYLAHMSCDYVDEKLRSGSKSGDLYLGLLCTIESQNVYGYMTNTRVKFLIVIPTTVPTKDSEVKAAFDVIHSAYIDLLGNPFYDPDSTQMVASPRFRARLQTLAAPVAS
ncbi:hypothetical protein GGF32_005271 [Allomyces javanicus]|nr:hypothetical protein GGF32_005271 [Allomyces javanicus]